MKRYLIRSLKYFAALCVLCMAIMALNLTTGMASLSLEETLYVMFHTPRGLLLPAVIVLLGAMLSMSLAWDTADLFQALMVIINIPVILILGNTAVKTLKDYMAQRKEGKDPHFKAANIGLKQETDYWN